MAAHVGQDDDGIVGINVTPLVDIMLVLLIIFMVASTYIVNPSIEVELPQAAAGGETVETTLALVLQEDGTLYLNGSETTSELVAAKCRELSRNNPATQAVIAADEAARHGQVVALIDLIKTNGITKFAINIEPTAGAATEAPQKG